MTDRPSLARLAAAAAGLSVPADDPAPTRWVLTADDPRFGLRAGDVLVCVPYWLDPDKLSVLHRESDRYDPRCNVYRSEVTPAP